MSPRRNHAGVGRGRAAQRPKTQRTGNESDDAARGPVSNADEGSGTPSVTEAVANLSREFLAFSADEINAGIARCLETAATIAGADRTTLMVVDDQIDGVGSVFEWSRPGINGLAPRHQPHAHRAFRHSTSLLQRGEVLQVVDLDSLPIEAAAERQDLVRRGVREHLTIPVRSRDTLIGYHIFERNSALGGWSDTEIHQLRLVGEIFGSAIKRQESESALRISRERYRALSEHANELVAEIDTKGRCLYASPSYFTILGYRCDELEGRTLEFLVHPEDIPQGALAIREAFQYEGEAHALQRLRRRDGEWRWIDFSGRAYEGPTGEIRFVSIGRDITERKKSEEAVERQLFTEQLIADLSRRFLNAPAEDIDDALTQSLLTAMELAGADRTYLLSIDTDAPWCTQVFEHFREGLDPHAQAVAQRAPGAFPWSSAMILRNEVLHISSLDELPPEAAAEAADCRERGVQSLLGIPVLSREQLVGFLCFECLERRQDWSPREVTQLRIVAEIFAAALDRKRSEKRLARQLGYEQRIAALSRRFLAADLEEIEDAIREALGEAAELAGGDRAYLLSFGQNADSKFGFFEWRGEGVPHTPAQSLPWAAAKVMAGETLYVPRVADLPPEAHLERADLESRGVHSLLGLPVFSGDALIGFLGIESMHAERWWTDQEMTLLRLIGELFTSALRRQTAEQALHQSQEQLLHAQKMEAVGRLAGGIAHDFNNLLTVILGFSRALLDDLSDDEEAASDVAQIHESAERAAALTRQLLTFSRRQIVEAQRVDVSECVAGVEEMLGRLLGEDVELALELSESVGSVWLDPHQLEQVLINLAVNARDAMPDGGQLLIRTSSRNCGPEERERLGLRKQGLHAVLSVSDSGTGIDNETLAHIFDPFFTTKEPGRGTGLGLSIVYSVVEQAGGGIHVEGAATKGTTFDIVLPRVESVENEAASTPAPDTGSGGGLILLVEDEGSVRRLTRRILERQDYDVLEAVNGRDALEIARAHPTPIDLVLTDVIMPEMGGPELATQLRDVMPDVPVLFMSGYPQDRGGVGDRPFRSHEFMQKPFSADGLLARIHSLIEEASSGSGLR